MDQKTKYEKEFDTQKLITSYENSNIHESYRRTPLQVPTYACYLNCAKDCSAGQNSIDRYLECTGFQADVIEDETDVKNVCLFQRDFTIHSKKKVMLPVKIPNADEFLRVPVRIFEGDHSQIPLRMGQDFDACLQEFASHNQSMGKSILEEGCELLGKSINFKSVNVTKCGMAIELDPYPRKDFYSKAVEGQLRMDEVIRKLEEGICYIEFVYAPSNDASARDCPTKLKDIHRMYGTKLPIFIPRANRTSNLNANQFDENVIRVFDVETSEWRSIKLETVILFRVKRQPYGADPSMEVVMSNMKQA